MRCWCVDGHNVGSRDAARACCEGTGSGNISTNCCGRKQIYFEIGLTFLFLCINLVLSLRFEGSSDCVGKENFLFIFLGLEFFSCSDFFDISRDVFFFFNLRLFVQVEGSGVGWWWRKTPVRVVAARTAGGGRFETSQIRFCWINLFSYRPNLAPGGVANCETWGNPVFSQLLILQNVLFWDFS